MDLGLILLHVNSPSLGYDCEDPISRQGHIRRHQGLGCGHIFLRDTVQPPGVTEVRISQDHSPLRGHSRSWLVKTVLQ